jgi:hypothetical protein
MERELLLVAQRDHRLHVLFDRADLAPALPEHGRDAERVGPAEGV